jgi:short-subunit dehydrogenase
VLAVSRSLEPLVRVADELKKESGAIVETLAADLASVEGIKAVVGRARLG